MADGDALDDKVSEQSEQAMREAEIVLLVVDTTVGVTPEDERVALLLRRSDTPVLVVANKVDDASHQAAIWEFMGLGLGEPFPVSALHGKGTGDLLDALITHLPEGSDIEPEEPRNDDPQLFSVSLVGRPTSDTENSCGSSLRGSSGSMSLPSGRCVIKASSRSPVPLPCRADTGNGSPSPSPMNSQIAAWCDASSTLLATTSTGVSLRRSSSATRSSSGVTPTVVSTTRRTISASRIACSDCSLTLSSRASPSAIQPPVSSKVK